MIRIYLNKKDYRLIIFIVGIIATIAYRSIIFLDHYDPAFVSLAWYIGTIGFTWYFAHRYIVEYRRNRVINHLQLIQKIEEKNELSSADRQVLLKMIKTLKLRYNEYNDIIIFVLSAIALLYGLLYDFTNLIN